MFNFERALRGAVPGLFAAQALAAMASSASSGPIPGRVLSNGPDGYELVAYVDCGPSRAAGSEGGHLRQLQGHSYTWPGAEIHGPLGSCAFDTTEVVYEVGGLRPGDEYVLGFTWWDFDRNGREQSVLFGVGEPTRWTVVLPASPAMAWHADQPTYAEVFLPIAEPYRKAGRFEVSFNREKATNVVVNEIWLLRRQKSDAGGQGRRRVAIITGDDYPGHLWRKTAPELAAILRADPRLEVTVQESPALLAAPVMVHYDAAVLHYMNFEGHPEPGEAVWKGLQQYVESGRGLVLVHFACGAFQSWSRFVKVAGRVYDPTLRGHDPHGSFEVRVTDRGHPVTAGMDDFKTTDELYTCLAGDTPVRVLAEATSVVDKKAYPIGFVHEVGKGRVFHSPLGHDVGAFKPAGARELFRRATAWAAGLPQMNTDED